MKDTIESLQSLLAEQEAIPTRIANAQLEQQEATKEGETGLAKHANARALEAFLTSRKDSIVLDIQTATSDLRSALESHFKCKCRDEGTARHKHASKAEAGLLEAGFVIAPAHRQFADRWKTEDAAFCASAVVYTTRGPVLFEIRCDELSDKAKVQTDAENQLRNISQWGTHDLLRKAQQILSAE